mmetsp:Transcript_22424/g.40452  ORF Transcript_22424/g.40452 Transcript_22424/m.40452 type:complete len:726 (-) Transcript_22424:145-2322(-)
MSNADQDAAFMNDVLRGECSETSATRRLQMNDRNIRSCSSSLRRSRIARTCGPRAAETGVVSSKIRTGMLLACCVCLGSTTAATTDEICSDEGKLGDFFRWPSSRRASSSACPTDIPPYHEEEAHIGDKIRSEASATSFFKSIDRDDDGSIGAAELASFVRNSIGGSAFDTASEVDSEVHKVLEALDLNHDDTLDRADVFSYWMQLESLLTTDEVAEWVVYAVQLPEYVGKIFMENVVTGYDFPELVENDGEALLTELNIEKSSFRKKIVRHMNARMLGVGTVPQLPSEARYIVEGCSTVSFTWKRASARGFPVHSYRIQRRAIGVYGSVKTESVSNKSVDVSTTFPDTVDTPGSSNSRGSSGWKTVYMGGENAFVDDSIDYGYTYIYRIQAWNSVGHSDWETVDISRKLKKLKCASKPNESQQQQHSQRSSWALIRATYVVVDFCVSFFRVICGLFALAASVMRFRRATATTTLSTDIQPICPWLWQGINNLSLRLFGVEVVPRNMLGDKDCARIEAELHDKEVKAVGLQGYRKVSTQDIGNRRADFRNKRGSDRELSALTDTNNSIEKSFDDKKSKIDALIKTKPLSFFTRNPSSKSEKTTSDSTLKSGKSVLFRSSSLHSSNGTGMIEGQHLMNRNSTSFDTNDDDDERCNTCQKRYKFGKRHRHHCAKCLATFCHKHGHTTHSNFTSCRVPGDCVCDVCLNTGHVVHQDGKRFSKQSSMLR